MPYKKTDIDINAITLVLVDHDTKKYRGGRTLNHKPALARIVYKDEGPKKKKKLTIKNRDGGKHLGGGGYGEIM